MPSDVGNVAPSATSTRRFPVRPSGMHVLGEHSGIRALDCVCRHGVRSPAIEGQFGRARISVVLAGAFHIRTTTGSGLLGPGMLMLGIAAAGYETTHVIDGGDRSLVFDYDAEILDEIAGVLAQRAPRFRTAAVPPSPAGTEAVVLAEQALRSCDGEALAQAALAVAILAVAADRGVAAPPPSRVQARRVARAMRHIELHAADDCSLEALAAEAGLSRYHFLRVFRAMTGQTPRQYVIAHRLRAAAIALRTSRTPVGRIALDAGFGDLSHFTASFALAFGTSPGAYRRRALLSRPPR